MSTDIGGTSSCSHPKGKKSISAAELDDHVVIVGKASIGTVDCRRVSNNSLINDPSDCNFPSHDLGILQDILNVPIFNVDANNQVCDSGLMDACDIAVERGFKLVSL